MTEFVTEPVFINSMCNLQGVDCIFIYTQQCIIFMVHSVSCKDTQSFPRGHILSLNCNTGQTLYLGVTNFNSVSNLVNCGYLFDGSSRQEEVVLKLFEGLVPVYLGRRPDWVAGPEPTDCGEGIQQLKFDYSFPQRHYSPVILRIKTS